MRLIQFSDIVARARQRTNTVGSRNPPDPDVMGFVADEFVQMFVRVMDASAISLLRENAIPVVVFSIREPGNLRNVLIGQGVFTVIGEPAET